MASDDSIIGSKAGLSPVAIANQSQVAPKGGVDAPKQPDGAKPRNDQVGQQEFLTLLVHQLQNQDPLNPMNSEEFAVQLAQFSQLEHLVSIDNKLTDKSGSDGSSVSSMASYLGHEVVLKDGLASFEGGRSPNNVLIDVPAGTQSARVDLVDAAGNVAGRYTLEDIEPGRQVVKLDGLAVPDGIYDLRVVSVNAGGQFVDLAGKITGTVEGFVLEPEPRLLIGGEEVGLEEISEVYQGVR